MAKKRGATKSTKSTESPKGRPLSEEELARVSGGKAGQTHTIHTDPKPGAKAGPS